MALNLPPNTSSNPLTSRVDEFVCTDFRRCWVRVYRASVLVAMVLGAAGWLMADMPDPTIRLTIPGGGSTDLCVPDKGLDSCTTTLFEAIGEDGFGSVDIKNVNKFAAVAMNFFFQTDNLDQPFSAFTTDFGVCRCAGARIVRPVARCGGTARDQAPVQSRIDFPSCLFAETQASHFALRLKSFVSFSNSGSDRRAASSGSLFAIPIGNPL